MKDDCTIDISKMTSAQNLKGDSDEDTNLLQQMSTQAGQFLTSQKWCDTVDRQYLAYGIGGIVGVFLCYISSPLKDVDSCLWVIVGDLPPAYIVTEDNPTGADALAAYIEEMNEWVEAVRNGTSVEDLIPVNVSPTSKFAEELRNRLDFLRTRVLPHMNN